MHTPIHHNYFLSATVARRGDTLSAGINSATTRIYSMEPQGTLDSRTKTRIFFFDSVLFRLFISVFERLCVLCVCVCVSSVQLRQCGGTDRAACCGRRRGSSTQTFIHFQCDIVMRAFLFKISVRMHILTCHLLTSLIDEFILS